MLQILKVSNKFLWELRFLYTFPKIQKPKEKILLCFRISDILNVRVDIYTEVLCKNLQIHMKINIAGGTQTFQKPRSQPEVLGA